MVAVSPLVAAVLGGLLLKESVRRATWLALGLAAIGLGLVPALGWLYFIPTALLTIDLLWRNIRLIRQTTPRNAKSLFLASNIYLTILLFLIFADTLLRGI